jgi:hypothetical protein
MAVIVDNDVVHEVFGDQPSFVSLRDWLFEKKYAKLAYGGILKTQILRHRKYREYLTELDRAGKIVDIPSTDIRLEKKMFECNSDDPDIIAIVRLKGIRLVSTRDGALKHDLGRKRLTQPVKRRCTRPSCKADCKVKIYNETNARSLLSKYGRCEYR